MLGVLAIIGVLSVGGIAGYSKAMTKFKVNKAVEEYNMLIAGLMEYKDDIFKNHINETGNLTKNIADFIYQTQIVPATWKKENNIFLYDSFGNRMVPYIYITDAANALFLSTITSLLHQKIKIPNLLINYVWLWLHKLPSSHLCNMVKED